MAITTAIAIATTSDERWKMCVEICNFTPSRGDGVAWRSQNLFLEVN